jgi:outer membrane protein TolC
MIDLLRLLRASAFRTEPLRALTYGLLALLMGVTLLASLPWSARSQDLAKDTVRIHLMVDDDPVADSLADAVEREVSTLIGQRRAVRLTDGPGYDVHGVIAVGPVTSWRACRAERAIPVIAVPTGSGVLFPSRQASCTAIRPSYSVWEALRAIAEAVPGIGTPSDRGVDVVVPVQVARSIPAAAVRVQRTGRREDVDVRLVTSSPDDTEQVSHSDRLVLADYIGRWNTPERRSWVASRVDRSLFVLAALPEWVESDGALAATDRNMQRRARHAAIEIESQVIGTPPPIDRVDRVVEPRVVINRRTADRLGVTLPWDAMVQSRVVSDDGASGAATTLTQAMQQSIRSNLSLRLKRQQTEAASHEIGVARSRFMPKLGAQGRGRLVNEDLASASLGSNPEELVTASIRVQQVLFSEPAFAQFRIEKRRQAVEEFEEETVRLDAAQRAANAYLSVLEANAGVRIQRENVRVVRANLEAARSRRSAGTAGPRAVSRLETQLARAEQRLLQALGGARSAEVRFNRVLNRPLDAPLQLDRVAAVDPEPVLGVFPYGDEIDQPAQERAFRTFWISKARDDAPEVRAVKHLVGARNRALSSANRSFWLPEVKLEGQLSERVYEGGAGATGGTLDLPGAAVSLPTPPDRQWSVGLTASFSIFDGGVRITRRSQAETQLRAAETQEMIAELNVEQAVRMALIDLETSRAAARRALSASDAAQRTLSVTQAAYREGTATVVDVIDAQTSAVTARQDASDAAYRVLRDWIAVQRASGTFLALQPQAEREAVTDRLQRALSRVD